MTTAARRLPTITARSTRPSRSGTGGAVDDRLFFAQVREDPCVEIAALQPERAGCIVAVSSGGCTALSLLAAGAREVHAVDVSRAQNHLVELKAAAVRLLGHRAALRFVGGLPASPGERLRVYGLLRDELTPAADAWWHARPALVRAGVLRAGESERFIALVSWLVRYAVQGSARVDRLLACRTLGEQRALVEREWRTRRWRWLFRALLNRWTMSRAYDPAFFASAGLASFAEHFRGLAEHALAELPVASNYFLHEMLTGRYPAQAPDGVPPYLSERGARVIASGRGTLRIVDGGVTEHLRSLRPRSVDGFALSNICEWLAPHEVIALFREVERVAAPGARVVFRNFVGFTALPLECRRLVEDPTLGAALAREDRSLVQYRVVVARVQEGA
jgi:S-adenosylmethionine-diacylglycerol 3-amino-3-carboxypropyl transferase